MRMGAATATLHAYVRRAAYLVLTGAVLSAAHASRAADDPPAMPKVETVSDPAGRVSIDLPPGAVRRGPPPGSPDCLEAWSLDLDGDPAAAELMVYVEERPQFARATLAGSTDWACTFGTLVPETARSGDGWWEESRRDAGGRYLARAIEGKDIVYVATVQVREMALATYRAHARQILDSFRALTGFRPRALPAGYTRYPIDGRELWTDAKKSDVDRIFREFAAACAAAQKLLPVSPAWSEPQRLVLCTKTEDYAALVSTPSSDPAPYAVADARGRQVVADLSQRAMDPFAPTLRTSAGQLVSMAQFGGLAPPWIRYGLALHADTGVTRGGRFDEPLREVVARSRSAGLRLDRTLEALISVQRDPIPNFQDFADLTYAWHFYLRFGPGEKVLGARYRRCLDALRKTGDARTQAKAWDGADQAKLHRDFLDWLAGWKGT